MGCCGKRGEKPIGTEGANGDDTGLPERKNFRHYIVKQSEEEKVLTRKKPNRGIS